MSTDERIEQGGVMRVVKLNGVSPREWLSQPSHVYVGRRVYLRSGKNAGQVWPLSFLSNPWKVSGGITVGTALRLFEERLRRLVEQKQSQAMAAMQSLTPDSVLGCWCVNSDDESDPIVCHAQIIRAVWRERFAAPGDRAE